jgi:protein-disulfide isomerase
MPSGKASKRARRVPPPPVQAKGAARKRQASPRVLAAAGGAVAVIVIGVVLGIVLSGGSNTSLADVPTVGSLSYGLPGASAVNALFKGIPQHGQVLGNPSAPVTLQEVVDAQCPYCQEYETQVLPSLVATYVRTGKVKILMEPWAFIGPDSIVGQAAELAAAQQNKMFNFAEVLYDNQQEENTGWITTSMLESIAESVPGLKVHTLINDRNSATIQAEQQTIDHLAAVTLKVTGTPTLFVGKSGVQGTEVNLTSATDEAAVVAALKAAGA